ncbi:Rhs element Vgr protein [Chitinophaga polysaccharea]|uniref:Rhs element Vgr protein n=1 Tax=Chitinophaga polysaccharea TaxID=1293035 RepID=A0A561PP26_9BACT|nr:contractile injection system protein, VgrG/Pvc8 family [Chitinophaga polysaccharea]TWF39859.1 Rhs element Vgr protein [Chitinophaga polysaccharea]
MALYTLTNVSIGEEQFKQFHALSLQQTMDGHHSLELKIGYDWLSRLGRNPIAAGKSFLGKDITVSVQAIDKSGDFKPLLFNGIVTAVSSGKESDGINGSCVIRATGPTVLLDGNPHIQSYERQELGSIVNTVLKTGSASGSRPEVNPATSKPLKYIVQYKETGYQFLRRLSERYGEWFFYNGQQIIFGQYTPRKINLVHQVDLINFDLELRVLPNNQSMNGWEYRQNKTVEDSTNAKSAGNTGSYTQHAQAMSEKLYQKPALYKVPFAFSGNAAEELQLLTKRQQQGQMAQMVQLKGHSKNTGLRIGDIVSIQENVFSREDHGEFVITALEHHCNGNGEYSNTFEAMPAEAAAPPVNLENIPRCEAQSAVVTDNYDPKGLGRIRVRFNWQTGSTPWIRLLQPHGGGDKGFYFVPEVGEEVWVDFEGGNAEAPYATGAAYNGGAKAGFGDAQNNVKVIKTRSGHTFRLDDSSGQESITISDKSGNVIVMDTSTSSISITAPENISIKATNISIQANENIDVNAGFNMTQAAGMNMSHSAGVNILHNAGDSISHFSVNDYRLTATNITKIATENMDVQARKIEKTAEEMKVDSSKEEMTINSGKSVAIKSAEKSKLF